MSPNFEKKSMVSKTRGWFLGGILKDRNLFYFLLSILFANMVLSFGCQNKNREIKALIPYAKDRDQLDPSSLMFSHEYILMDNMTIRLVNITNRSDYEYHLAKEIITDKSETSFIVKLKKAQFSDGTPITAKDVSDSFKRAVIKGSLHVPLKDIFLGAENLQDIKNEIAGIKVVSNDELHLKLKRKTKEFFYYLSLADLGILHPSLIKIDSIKKSDWKVGSGAFTLVGDTLVENKRFVFYDSSMPAKVHLFTYPKTGGVQDIIGYDLGSTNFFDREKKENQVLPKDYRYFSDSYQMLCYLVLNPKSEHFNVDSQRHFFARNILNNFETPKGNKAFKKAVQFFPPGAKGFLANKEIDDLLSEKIEVKQSFDSLKIIATGGTKKFTFSGLSQQLSDATGVNVEINFSDSLDDYHKRKELKNFDAYLVPTSLNYNQIVESLNIVYKANKSFGQNPNGRIIALMNEYQKDLEDDNEVAKKISIEILKESEIVPLYYLSSPDFYNTKRLELDNYNSTESMAFWRLRIK